MASAWLKASTMLTAAVVGLAPAAAARAEPAPPPAAQTVLVQAGDTLWGLARRNGTTVAELQRLNHLGTSTLIRIGQTLILSESSRAARVAVAVAYAKAQIGKPYRFATAGPETFDCSGLVMRAWQAAGVRLPRVTYDQIKVGRRVTRDQLEAGDLVFTNNGGHVMLYIGDGQVVNAGHTGVTVSQQPLPRTERVVAFVRLPD
ncbi:LysM peptidoglycan-binding domain-containing C40 family peptidase [Dactylosporangium aurantiacum]|uniref:LysM peptidoglycan-binding domain-containing C40 family peptidase n=1 Tax=Dactylosporangium aurantiacum TaxID=35754 RepID=A0A9Q9I8R3_9ACTN|nr:LysM peptidoglycan-binding domain-containing C40 family peptidase [Dactylosporangium aurantiacum]MDG6107173.1 LysM peptidoglycan-binding domain-containing C40 family peptidase [Dactylosporangium aurantiacum]UWZ51467.1 LysM peptidoglycan-binding domain-containing C40 family peptidase [Dactylosporangium aurantiacum]